MWVLRNICALDLYLACKSASSKCEIGKKRSPRRKDNSRDNILEKAVKESPQHDKKGE